MAALIVRMQQRKNDLLWFAMYAEGAERARIMARVAGLESRLAQLAAMA